MGEAQDFDMRIMEESYDEDDYSDEDEVYQPLFLILSSE
jgi:hypothetical protein